MCFLDDIVHRTYPFDPGKQPPGSILKYQFEIVESVFLFSFCKSFVLNEKKKKGLKNVLLDPSFVPT